MEWKCNNCGRVWAIEDASKCAGCGLSSFSNIEDKHTTLGQYDIAFRGGAVVQVTSKDDLVKVFRDNWKEPDAVVSLSGEADGCDAVLVVREIAAVVKTGEGSR